MVSLLESQNSDGGWPYQRGGPSWTEPTAYALLALAAEGFVRSPVTRGLGWLSGTQRADGGWAPQPHIRLSGYATAVVALLGPGLLGAGVYGRALAWILGTRGADSNLPSRLRQLIIGNAPGPAGWPWLPGSNAWVTPTSLCMLALRKAPPALAVVARLDEGARYLEQHVCRDGGWNYGAPQVLGCAAGSYPETTGVALLALAGRASPVIGAACRQARRQLAECRTAEGESWLRLGLQAHGELAVSRPWPLHRPRTVTDQALILLAGAASSGRNLFLE